MIYRTAEPEGDGYGFGALEGVVEQRIAYPGPLRCSDQVDVQNILIPGFGLFKRFSEVLILLQNQSN